MVRSGSSDGWASASSQVLSSATTPGDIRTVAANVLPSVVQIDDAKKIADRIVNG
ncbi:hypothetical protein [Amycolatopsis sp. WGS_07]|uniref:hypothetical protein n=1 Tax=Amycolatopsis sp. WGS_07 TaxID=3076764 RepID=UPI003872E921